MAYHIELFYQVSRAIDSAGMFTFPRVSKERKPRDVTLDCISDKYYRDIFKLVHVYEMWVAERPDDASVMRLFENYKWVHLEELNKIIKETIAEQPDKVYRIG
jgi:hypothetical protein